MLGDGDSPKPNWKSGISPGIPEATPKRCMLGVGDSPEVVHAGRVVRFRSEHSEPFGTQKVMHLRSRDLKRSLSAKWGSIGLMVPTAIFNSTIDELDIYLIELEISVNELEIYLNAVYLVIFLKELDKSLIEL